MAIFRGELYDDGIEQAAKEGRIQSYGKRFRFLPPSLYGPQDDFACIERKKGALTFCNTRHLDPITSAVLRHTEALRRAATSTRASLKALFLGPGACVEVGDAQKIFDAAGVVVGMETISRTPVNPYWILRHRQHDLRDLVLELFHQHLGEPDVRRLIHDRAPIDVAWNNRERLPGLFEDRRKSPLPGLQHIGTFPADFRRDRRAMNPYQSEQYDYVLEDRGVTYYTRSVQALENAYRMLSASGVLCLTCVGEDKDSSDFRNVVRPGDVALTEGGIGYCVVARRESPLARALWKFADGRHQPHIVGDIPSFLLRKLSVPPMDV